VQTPLFRYEVGYEISSARSGHARVRRGDDAAAMIILGSRRWTARTVVPNVKNGESTITVKGDPSL
jgi:hypothetical protein